MRSVVVVPVTMFQPVRRRSTFMIAIVVLSKKRHTAEVLSQRRGVNYVREVGFNVIVPCKSRF